MIKSFKNKDLEGLFREGVSMGLLPAHERKVQRILFFLDQAKSPRDMNLPGWRPHLLEPKKDGFWSVEVNKNWRITWQFDEKGDAEQVDMVDYH